MSPEAVVASYFDTWARVVPCDECRRAMDEHFPPGLDAVNPSDVEYLHFLHRPMHWTEMGRDHHKTARAAWKAWEALAPRRCGSEP